MGEVASAMVETVPSMGGSGGRYRSSAMGFQLEASSILRGRRCGLGVFFVVWTVFSLAD
jgi:hypothetical protein